MESAGIYSFDIKKYFELAPKDYIQVERESLRQSLLYFDKLVFPAEILNTRLNYLQRQATRINKQDDFSQLLNDFESLVETGLIEEFSFDSLKRGSNSNLIPLLETLISNIEINKTDLSRFRQQIDPPIDLGKLFIENHLFHSIYEELICKISAQEIEKKGEMSICPIVHSMTNNFKNWLKKMNSEFTYPHLLKETHPATSILLKNIPTPSSEVSIEQLIDFKKDPDTRHKLLALRTWVSTLNKGNYTQSEISDRLEYTLEEYKKHLDIHKLKTNFTSFEIYTITTAEIIENIIKLQFGKAIKNILTLKKKKVELIEAELRLPGKEIAYLIKVKQLEKIN